MTEIHHEAFTQNSGTSAAETYSLAPDDGNPDAFLNLSVAGSTMTNPKLVVLATDDGGNPTIDVRLPPLPHGATVYVRQGGVMLYQIVGGQVAPV